jgi:predicted amidophosphoribosyltransferase
VFREKYRKALDVRASTRHYDRVLLVDDVCTHGNTLAEAAQKMREMNPDIEIVAATAGQMIVKECVLKRRAVLANGRR